MRQRKCGRVNIGQSEWAVIFFEGGPDRWLASWLVWAVTVVCFFFQFSFIFFLLFVEVLHLLCALAAAYSRKFNVIARSACSCLRRQRRPARRRQQRPHFVWIVFILI